MRIRGRTNLCPLFERFAPLLRPLCFAPFGKGGYGGFALALRADAQHEEFSTQSVDAPDRARPDHAFAPNPAINASLSIAGEYR